MLSLSAACSSSLLWCPSVAPRKPPAQTAAKPKGKAKAKPKAKAKSKGGRPSLFTAPRRKKIVESIQAGNTRKVAAMSVGVTDRILYKWLARGSKHEEIDYVQDVPKADQPFFRFFQDVKKAEADAEAYYVGRVKHAADDGTWTAAAWWLERRRTDTYGKRIAHDVPPEVPAAINELTDIIKQVYGGSGKAQKRQPSPA